MAENALRVEFRENAGKGVARKLRAAGRIPAVCYAKGDAAVAVSLDPAALRRLLEDSEGGMNTLIALSVAGGGTFDGRTVLVRELQRDPVLGGYLHADLFAVDMQQTIEVSVPLHVVGKAPGLEMGGIVDQQLREIDLECLPRAIPKELEVDVGALELGDSLHVRDIALPAGVTLRTDPDLSVVSVVAPSKAEEEPAEPTEEEAAEGEGVEGEEGAEAPAADAGGEPDKAAEKGD